MRTDTQVYFFFFFWLLELILCERRDGTVVLRSHDNNDIVEMDAGLAMIAS